MADTQFRPVRGGVTFDSEGNEGGKYHSRKLHVPGSTSGLTIGRGYDMGAKTAAQITTDLTTAGVELAMAKTLSGAATLRGENAKKFIKDNKVADFEISELAQKTLFEITYASEESTARGVCERAKDYGTCDWEKLHPAIQEMIVDLKYRGDYTPETRKLVQPLIVANDLEGFAKAIANEKYWVDGKNVPLDRFKRRRAFIEEAVAKQPLTSTN